MQRENNRVAGKEDGLLGKKGNTVVGKPSGKAAPADPTGQVEQEAADRWYNQALESSTTIHLVTAVCMILSSFFGWVCMSMDP